MPASSRPALWRAVTAALVVLVAGFGGMLAFYSTARHSPGQRGLFDFTSATWGDGLLLPIMTGALVFAAGSLPRAVRERIFACCAGLLGAGLGVASQVLWLRDDTPGGNWTFPAPHHFNAAGKYHAVFLVVMCGTAGALWALALSRLADAAPGTGRRRAAAGVTTAGLAGCTFVALLVVDSAAGSPTGASRTTVVTAAIGVVVILTGSVLAGVRLARRGRADSGDPPAR